LHLQRELPVIGLTGEILVDAAPALRLAWLQAAAVAAICLAFGALLFLATERRRTLAQANTVLESRVAERTQELSDTNARLRREVLERKEAEAALQRAQTDLIQAGKLSALGQMSAGISHELNQPLMAIRSFAENGAQYLDRGDSAKVAENLGRISELARRMGRIIKNLRAFARQESEAAGRVDLVAVLNGVIELTETRMRGEGVTVDFEAPEHPVWVRGGEVRLGQVFVNLLSNAADAMDGQDGKRILVKIEASGPVLVTVADSGPGLAMPEKVFEPFYSTKVVGASEGMGLGLSISYGIVQSFGGEIRGENGPEGGAVFTVRLDPWREEWAA
jgi:two-component system C4-dicarboxylate transport sensor histidine kinase DctB